MEVRNCRGCGRLYNYIGGVSYGNLCPRCVEQLEEKFQIAKKYIEDNHGAGMEEVARVADVKTTQIERWVREERLYFADDSMVAIGCQNCGKMIRGGYYCQECKDNMTKNLSSAYGTQGVDLVRKKPKGSAQAKMRFLDGSGSKKL